MAVANAVAKVGAKAIKKSSQEQISSFPQGAA